jgi:hypothetical protein
MAVLEVGCTALDTHDVIDVGPPVVYRCHLKHVGNQSQLGKPKHKETAAAAQDHRPS